MLSSILGELSRSNIPGFLFSMLIPLLFLIIMIKDRQSKYVLLYFCWGLCAVLFAFVLNEWFSAAGQNAGMTSDIAPIVEETLKALPLLLFFRKGSSVKSNLIIYCALASGIGFSVQETLYYFTSFASSFSVGGLFPLLIRTVTTCLMHGMSTATIGFGIAITARHKGIRVPMVLGLLALSATIHSLYNILISTRLAVIALVMPAILYFMGLALLSGNEQTDGGAGSES